MAVMSAYDPSYRTGSKPAENLAFEGWFSYLLWKFHLLFIFCTNVWHVISYIWNL